MKILTGALRANVYGDSKKIPTAQSDVKTLMNVRLETLVKSCREIRHELISQDTSDECIANNLYDVHEAIDGVIRPWPVQSARWAGGSRT